MKNLNKLVSILKNLLSLLEKEKLALISNDGEKVAEIVKAKIDITEEIENLAIKNSLEDKRVISLIGQINELQETNLLLTKQALKYQEVLIESIAKNLSSKAGTYEGKGSLNIEQSINFIKETV